MPGLPSKKAEKTASLNDAILYAEKGIACLERLPASDEVQKKIIDARTVLGLYLLQMNNSTKPKEVIDPIIESAAQRGYSRRLAQIYTVIGAFDFWVKEDIPRALEHLTRALELADQVGDLISWSWQTISWHGRSAVIASFKRHYLVWRNRSRSTSQQTISGAYQP